VAAEFAVILISSGRLRRLAQPILFRYWLKSGTNRIVDTRVGGFNLRVLPTVFHPKYFGSSLILGRYVESLDLKGKRFLDMGTGSGIVGLFAARAGAIVTGVDINPQAIQCAAGNAAAAGFHIEYRQSDLFSSLAGERFDVIAWNPPFFPKRAETDAEAALYAGEGYASIERFAQDCRAHLTDAGRVVLILSLDIDVAALESIFRREGLSPGRALTQKWGLGETMVILHIQ
jgi:release factor glutamine methyltransferase